MKFINIVAASVACCAPMAAVVAQMPSAPLKSTGKSTSSTANPDRIICRTDDETGSRLTKKKMCMTAAQWRDYSYRSGQLLEQRTYAGKPGGS